MKVSLNWKEALAFDAIGNEETPGIDVFGSFGARECAIHLKPLGAGQ